MLSVVIRDNQDCTTEIELPSVTVIVEQESMVSFIDGIQQGKMNLVNHPFFWALETHDTNTICQIINLFGDYFDETNVDYIQNASFCKSIEIIY